MMKLLKIIIILFSNLLINTAFGQQMVIGDIEPSNADGLHKVLLPHEIRSFAKLNFEDIRIYDSKNKEIAYFVTSGNNHITSNHLESFEIIATSQIKDTSSTYIFTNPKEKINQLSLLIANYEGRKKYNLLGSNDLKQWFGITKTQPLDNLNKNLVKDTAKNTGANTQVSKTINFPWCDYRFLKIVIDDRESLPINVVKIGEIKRINHNDEQAQNISIKKIEFEEVPVSKKTTIKLNFVLPKTLNTIQLKINKPGLYHREAVLYYFEKTTQNQKPIDIKRVVKKFTLNSSLENTFNFSDVTAKTFYVDIFNQDNSPLHIAKLEVFQNTKYVVANLKKEEVYKIKAGDHSLPKANYDIDYFRSELNSATPILKVTNISKISAKTSNETVINIRQKQWVIWLIIGLAIVIIGVVTKSLVKDLKN